MYCFSSPLMTIHSALDYCSEINNEFEDVALGSGELQSGVYFLLFAVCHFIDGKINHRIRGIIICLQGRKM